jgi:hypothetical protein
MVNLIYMLAVAGWDCRNLVFSNKAIRRSLDHAVVYQKINNPRDPKKPPGMIWIDSESVARKGATQYHAHGIASTRSWLYLG